MGFKPGLRVLVTAGGSGIGRVIAETFASAGARLHVCDVSDAALADCNSNFPDWGITHCDVSDEEQVATLFENVKAHLGGLDVLINNAGIAGPTGGIDELDPQEWRNTVEVNLNGQFYCARLAVPLLKKSSDASIIGISSVAGRLGYAWRTPYAATKWAIIGLIKSLAIELGPDGIRVNALLPGIVEGPRIEKVIAARAEATGVSYEDMEREYINKVSLRRMVTAQDIANQALYLCSPLGANISGQAISICGNVEVL
jgi:NAD(P)-dependent dehydrogenase (short-subunit alcohol dehydrogenase family)